MVDIRLFEADGSRSVRCKWTLLEAGMEYQSAPAGLKGEARGELESVHPMKMLPAAVIDGQPLIESAAIATYIADNAPEANLIAKPGTWARALHDQWVSFALTQMEAWLWSSARNRFVLPKEERVPEVFKQNAEAYQRAAAVVDKALAADDYLVENRFSVTDIIVGYTVNWGRRAELNGDLPNLGRYLERLWQRPHCTLTRD